MPTEEIKRKRAYYRACHRGTKEMDLVLGGFARAFLDGMPAGDVATFETLLDFPDSIIDRWLKGADPDDSSLKGIIRQIQAHCGLPA
jgi:antitoxin CptB